MRRFWRRDRSLSELEGELRARRADPPKAFLSALADRARVDQRSLRPSFRLSPVYGVALIAVVALVVAGGAGLVQSGSSGASRLFDRLASSSSPTNVSGSSGDDQYEDVCGSAPRKKRCVITIDDESVTEPQSGCVIADFIVSLATRSDQTVTVQYRTRNGTASTTDGDYASQTGTVTFAPGQTQKTINIQVCHDVKSSNSAEQFYVDLFGQSPNATIGRTPGTGTIYQVKGGGGEGD